MIVIAACTSSKKSTTSTAASTTTTTATVTTTATTAATPTTEISPTPIIKPADGIYSPGDEELTAIQPQFKDATLDKLKEGYFIYAKGACIKCHGTANIYGIDPFRWGFICDNMAMKANLTQLQKEAVYQYVLSIKATKSK
jgi:hypothetical protein